MADETKVVQGTEQQGAEQAAQSVVVVAPPQGSGEKASNNQQGLFNQEQLNLIIQSRVNPLNDKIKTLNEQLSKAQDEVAQYKAQVEGFAQKESAKKLGIADAFIDFAIFNAQKLAVDGKTFEVALGEYVNANKALLGIPEENTGANGSAGAVPPTLGKTVSPTVQTQPATQKMSTNVGLGNTAQQGVDAQVGEFLKKHGLRKG